jgi:hypothetical protein
MKFYRVIKKSMQSALKVKCRQMYELALWENILEGEKNKTKREPGLGMPVGFELVEIGKAF